MKMPVDAIAVIPGYQLIEQLYAGSRTVVYRGIKEADKVAVVVKLLQREYPTFSELLQFRNQYTIAKNLASPGIVQPASLEPYRNSYALVMEDFGGISLRDYVQNQPLTLTEFLEIALQLSDILKYLYHQQIIHKDIKPANILIHPQTKQVKIIDFSIASLLPKETQEIKNPNILEGTLAYLAPEQTGRMNRGIDYRADFYALGVTFFELLTGQLPFLTDDPMELVHCHIAKEPPNMNKPHLNKERVPEEGEVSFHIPQVLCDIVMKLMAKNAEDRYQSALGLKYDLEICLNQLKATGKIEVFKIGQRDLCDRFLIPEKLYGREKEVEQLLESFERVSQGSSELMLVAGFSGIGKTAVVNEVHKPIVRQRGYFIKGKFDQFNRNIPFSAFVQAFRDLMMQLLTESDKQLQQWKANILEAVGENGQVIIEVIPELEKIIGQQPPTAELSGTAAQNRFNLLFQKFLKVFTTKSHPLVMFLDDLQWADSASLKLMQLLMSEANISYLLLLGAYRDNEVSAAHALMLTLEEIRKANATINTITLAPLNPLGLNQLVADTLSCSLEVAEPLTQLVYQKSQGNPFFSTQFLRAIYEDNLIIFCVEKGYWQCDIAALKALTITDDIVEFMALQLQKLPEATQNVLKFAACIGNQFDLATLAIVSQQSQIETALDLWRALQEGFILPQSEIYKFYIGRETQELEQNSQIVTYKFLHDRVQQAAYSLIPDSQKETTHLKIGRLLLQDTTPEERKDNIFVLVNQLNYGTELLTLESEKYELAELNLIAGQKAKTSAAYEAALPYLKVGLELLAVSSWQHQYALTLALYDLAAEIAYLNGDFEQMEQWADIVLQQAKTSVDKMKVYAVKIQADMAQIKLLSAVKIGLQALELLGISLPESPDSDEIKQALAQTTTNLEGKNIEDLMNLPLMTDIKQLAATKMLMSIGLSTYQAAPELFPLVVCELVNFSIKYGTSPFSSYGYAAYGTILNAMFQNMELGYQFGKLAINLAEKFNDLYIKASTLLMAAGNVIHGKVHVRETLPILWDSYQSGLDSGNFEFSGYAAVVKCLNSYFMGQELTGLEREMATMSNALARLKQENTVGANQIFQQSVLNLLNVSENPWSLQGEVYNEEKYLVRLKDANDITKLHFLYLNKLILSYLFREYEQAKENALQAEQYLNGVQGLLVAPVFYFYDSLAHLAIYQSVPQSQQEHLWSRVTNNQQKMKQWATHAPMNFLHKYYLVEAEKHRILGQKTEAIELFDCAIKGAKQNDYIQEEALANELAAKFYLDWGKEKVAAGYLQEAYYSYARWGAKAKVNDLEKHYPHLLQPILQQQKLSFNPLESIAAIANISTHKSTLTSSSSSTSISDALDFTSVLKAAQVISSSIQLDELITSLTKIILENAGAKKCVLILPHEGKWQIRAITSINPGENLTTTLLNLELLDDFQEVPVKLIQYVKRTLEPVVIDNCQTEISGVIANYMLQHRPKSVLCMPILNQGHLVGILYLENSLTSGVFTSDRIFILNFLCTQAAISLENAQLYTNLQASEARFQHLADNVPGMIYRFRLATDGSMSCLYVSSGCYEIYETQHEQIIANAQIIISMTHPEDVANYYESIAISAQTLQPWRWEGRIITPSGKVKWIQGASRPERQADGSSIWDGLIIDISDRKEAEAIVRNKSHELELAMQDLQQAQLQLVQSEKMSALGNLVAGIAHEINNPIGFIAGNISPALDYLKDIFRLLDLYQQEYPQPSVVIASEIEAIDLEYVREDLPKVIGSMKLGINRIRDISTSLRTFSRADQDYKVACNLHEGIDSTILILKHRLKANESHPAMEVITEYGNLPQVECFPGQLNQVFMNLLANAIDALEESNQRRSFLDIQTNPNRITIRTVLEDNYVKICIADNGIGMTEAVKQRIFDHLFTTKNVGKGTGLGLAIARQIVVEKHGGQITVKSEVGKGTEFAIVIRYS